MAKILIDSVKEVEKAKQAIPFLRRQLEDGSFTYMAGSLILSMSDPTSDSKYTCMNVRPIQETESEIIREAQYLTSLMYVKHKGETCHFYKQALSNIEEYERIHEPYGA